MQSKVVQVALTILFGLGSGLAQALEEPEFAVLRTVDGIEYRQYQPYVVAETMVTDAERRGDASNVGFRRLFAYISGENQSKTDIAMTAPVQQVPTSAKISMTAPVRQSRSTNGWAVAFVLPDELSLETAPEPLSSDISLRQVPGDLVAVLKYSGRWSDNNINLHKSVLLAKLSAAAVSREGEVVSAFYNSPFSLPFMRRNEVMVTVNGLPQDTAAR